MENFVKCCIKFFAYLGWFILVALCLSTFNASFSTSIAVMFWAGWITNDVNSIFNKMWDNIKKEEDKDDKQC